MSHDAREAFPAKIGRLYLGEKPSDGGRLCDEGHTVPAGHPLYWPESMGQYDDRDPDCLSCAIERLEREQYSEVGTLSPDPVLLGEVREALSKTLDHYWLNVCVHEETHRGGYLWTICNGCDTKWADDRGGFVPFVEPEEITRATALLAKLPKLTGEEV